MNKGFFAYIFLLGLCFLLPLFAMKEGLWGEEPGWHKEMAKRNAIEKKLKRKRAEKVFEDYERKRKQAFKEYKRKKRRKKK